MFIGPYDFNTIRRKALKKIVYKFNINLEKFKNLDLYKLDRKFNPLRIFVSHEPYVPELIHYDFSVTPHLSIDDNKHLESHLGKIILIGLMREFLESKGH